MLCSPDLGPCFNGSGNCELGATEEPYNGEDSCSSVANEPGYGIPVDTHGINMLTNRKDGNFTISELEVWEVAYSE